MKWNKPVYKYCDVLEGILMKRKNIFKLAIGVFIALILISAVVYAALPGDIRNSENSEKNL
jgi:hypothetical protein